MVICLPLELMIGYNSKCWRNTRTAIYMISEVGSQPCYILHIIRVFVYLGIWSGIIGHMNSAMESDSLKGPQLPIDPKRDGVFEAWTMDIGVSASEWALGSTWMGCIGMLSAGRNVSLVLDPPWLSSLSDNVRDEEGKREWVEWMNKFFESIVTRSSVWFRADAVGSIWRLAPNELKAAEAQCSTCGYCSLNRHAFCWVTWSVACIWWTGVHVRGWWSLTTTARFFTV